MAKLEDIRKLLTTADEDVGDWNKRPAAPPKDQIKIGAPKGGKADWSVLFGQEKDAMNQFINPRAGLAQNNELANLAAGAAGLPPAQANQLDPNNTGAPGGPLKKPVFGVDKNNDGRITGDEINAQYRLGRGRGGLTGLRLGSMMAQKYTNPYAQLGAVIGATIRGLLDPEAAGRMEYEEDVKDYYIETESEYKQKKLMADLRMAELRQANTLARTTAIENKNKETDATRRASASRSVVALMFQQAGNLTAEDRPQFMLEARKELGELWVSTGMDATDAESLLAGMNDQTVVNQLGVWGVDPKSKAFKSGSGWYRLSAAGIPIAVTDQTGAQFMDISDKDKMDLAIKAAKFDDGELKKAIAGMDAGRKTELFQQALKIAGTQAERLKSGVLSPTGAYLVKGLYESLLVEEARKSVPKSDYKHSFRRFNGSEMDSKDVYELSRRLDSAAAADTQAPATGRVVDTTGQTQLSTFVSMTSEAVPFGRQDRNTVTDAEWTSIQNDVMNQYGIMAGGPGSPMYEQSILENESAVRSELNELRAKRSLTTQERARVKALQTMEKRFQHIKTNLYEPVAAASDTMPTTAFFLNYNRLSSRAANGIDVSSQLRQYDEVARQRAGEKPMDLKFTTQDGVFNLFNPNLDQQWNLVGIGNTLAWRAKITSPNMAAVMAKAMANIPVGVNYRFKEIPNARVQKVEGPVDPATGKKTEEFIVIYSPKAFST